MANRKKEKLGKEIVTLWEAGWTQYKISQKFKMQPSLVAYYIKKYGKYKNGKEV